MASFEWDPETYLAVMLEEIPGYVELQDAVADAAAACAPRTVLELGTGTGETALRVLGRCPGIRWAGIDASPAMLDRARGRLPADAELRVARLEDPLPDGPFDLVVSALAVHHLDADAKRDLFLRVARAAERFVLGDVVVPQRPEDAAIEIDGVYDTPSSVPDQLAWLDDSGYDAEATLIRPDLALFRCRRR